MDPLSVQGIWSDLTPNINFNFSSAIEIGKWVQRGELFSSTNKFKAKHCTFFTQVPVILIHKTREFILLKVEVWVVLDGAIRAPFDVIANIGLGITKEDFSDSSPKTPPLSVSVSWVYHRTNLYLIFKPVITKSTTCTYVLWTKLLALHQKVVTTL